MKQTKEVPVKEERVEEVNPIKAEEAFTLARDVFNVRSAIIGIYNNRASISKKIALTSLIISILYTLFYVALTIVGGVTNELKLGVEIAIYCTLGIYLTTCVALIIFTAKSPATKRKNKALKIALKVARLVAKLFSIAMSVVAIVLYGDGGGAWQIICLTVSIVALALQAIPLIFGGVWTFIKWLFAPEVKKIKFGYVVGEWFALVKSGEKSDKLKFVVDKKYYKDIERCINTYLINLEQKDVLKIRDIHITSILDGAPEKDLPVIEGVFKNVFDYAQACSYVTFNPCESLGLKGNINVIKKPSLIKELGKKVVTKIYNKVAGIKD